MTTEEAQALVDNDPVLRQYWQQIRNNPNPPQFDTNARLQQLGIDPKEFQFTSPGKNPTGFKIAKQGFFDKHDIAKWGALGVAGLVGGAALAPAFTGAAGGTAAATGSGASAALGAAGTPAELTALGGSAGPMAVGTAPTIAGVTTGTAAGSGWASWLPQIANVGAQVGGYFNNKNALNTAKQDQQAATNQAMAIQNKAAQTAGDVYQQQRQDTQNLFGVPYQTLGGLMGLNIPSIGAPQGAVPTNAQPTGYPRGLTTMPIQAPYPGAPMVPSDLTPIPLGTLPNGMELPLPGQTTLKELAKLGSQQTRQSGYQGGR